MGQTRRSAAGWNARSTTSAGCISPLRDLQHLLAWSIQRRGLPTRVDNLPWKALMRLTQAGGCSSFSSILCVAVGVGLRFFNAVLGLVGGSLQYCTGCGRIRTY